MKSWNGTPDAGWEQAQAELEALGLTDGLPVVPPTAARVGAMLAANGLDPARAVCNLAPVFQPALWRDIAFNAVMAGCRADCLPVVGTALEAMAADEFNLMGVTTTTGSAAPLIVVNGPIAARTGMNAAGNALGPGSRANATIGRAVSLCLRNIGGATVGEVDMATLGQPAKYTCCLAENEAQSPWPPLHVERGYGAGESVVTVVAVSGIVEVVDSASGKAAELARTYSQSMLIAGTAGGAGMLGSGEPLLLVPPEHAQTCARGGWTKDELKRAVHEDAVMPLDRLSPAVREHLVGRRAGGEPGPRDGALRAAQQPGDVMIVVAGGVGVKGAYVPTWGTSRSVSRLIRNA